MSSQRIGAWSKDPHAGWRPLTLQENPVADRIDLTPRRAPWWRRPASWRKGQAALATFVGVLVSQGLLTGTAEAVTNGALTLVGALAVIVLDNEDA